VEHIPQISSAINATAFDLYAQLKGEPGNVFISPYSIETALSMAYEGARGTTASEMAQSLSLPEDAGVRQPGFAALQGRLNALGDGNELSVANALWAQRDYAILPKYTNAVQRWYGGQSELVDFMHDTEGARRRINAWVEEQTRDRIKNLFEAGTLDPLARMVLTNAIYFKGSWDKQFDPDDTRDADFTPSSGAVVKAKLMASLGEEAKYSYAEADGVQLLELPYAGGKLAMLVALPAAGKLAELESQLSAELLEQWRSQLTSRRVDVYFPRFKSGTKYQLNGALQALGMREAFTDRADFTGITAKRELYIDLVIHQADLEVNEEGTVAAAATGISFRTVSAMPPGAIPVFRADRPFLYFILDREHGTVLFMGRLERPE
jgi:serpin B